MMKQFKRIICMILALAMVITNLPQMEYYAYAEEKVINEIPSNSLDGKTISILGASISTYAGTSNGDAADKTNSTIRNNVKYYPNSSITDVELEDTWWMQVVNDFGLELLVNNSWSGSLLLHERNGTVGAYVDRCVQLHDDTGENEGQIPDIIGIQMGTNDFQYYKDTLGTADIDYATLITDNGDGSYTYAEPVTSLEAAAIVLHKISVRYPDAEVYYLNISQRVDGTDELIQSFNAELKEVVEHFDAHIVDIYGSAITMEDFDKYIGDGRVHPNSLGMDAYTEAFKKSVVANTQYSVDAHTVSLELSNVTADYGTDKIVVSGDSYSVNLASATGDELQVTVTMGEEDITASCYSDGIVSIDSVTDDVKITATTMEHSPVNYRWEFDGTDLVSVSSGNNIENALTKNSGSATDGVFSSTKYELDKAVILDHDEPWSVEWKCEGTWKNSGTASGGRMFTTTDVNAEYNARYIFKSANSYLIAMGEKDTKGSHNYGIALSDYDIDGSALHTYRLENRIAEDGSNMIYLYVDGEEIGAMNNYYIGTNSQNTTSDWLSGKDFEFKYIGTDTHGLNNCSIEYIQVWEGGKKQDFSPVLRFAVTSDTHIRDSETNDYSSRKHLAEFIRTAYDYSEAQSDYTKLDGIFFVGDNTQNGSEVSQTYFFNYINEHIKEDTISRAVMGNHEFYSTGHYSSESFAQAPLNFLKYSGYDSVDAHLVINGYHFIFLSMDAYSSGVKFSNEKLEWLSKELQVSESSDETGKKPIFVFQHEPPEGAVGGAIRSASDTKLTKILSEYPQVVDFSGHTHRAITDPHSIWQDTFTALTTGSLAYITVPIVGHPTYSNQSVIATDDKGSWSETLAENGIRNGGMYYIVEVNEDSRVRVSIYDIFTNSLYGEPIYLEGIGNPEAFTLTEHRKTLSEKPVFLNNDKLLVSETREKQVVLEIPQATCVTDPVQNYRVDVYCEGLLIDSVYRLACTYYGSATPSTISATISNLEPETEYTFKVYAVNSFGIEGSPIIIDTKTLPLKESETYRWEFDGKELSSVNSNNTLSRLSGSIVDGIHNKSIYQMYETINLYHDRPWSLEWQSEGKWSSSGNGALLFAESGSIETKGAQYLYRRKESDLIALGTYNGSKYQNYGVVLTDYGIDGTTEHIYRLENHISNDGSNMIYLYVDEEKIGPMNQYFVNGVNQNTTSNWVSGKDFVFSYMGEKEHPINSCSIEYIQVWEAGKPSESMSMQYDDHLDITDKTVEIIDHGTPTSYQVGYGVEEGTLDTAVVTIEDNYLVATGIGSAKVRIDGVLYEVTVEAAPISLLLLAGQSNMQGSEGDANQSIVCPEGMVYSTYGDRYTMTTSNATNYAPSALTGAGSGLNVNGNTTNLADWPVYLLNEEGAGKAGPDSGFAYEWVKQTGEKVWIVNAAHGGSSITTWQNGGANYEEAILLFSACQETLRKEIAAGHYTLSHMGYFWCQGCTDYSKTAEWYVNKYLTMHNNFKTELAFDADSDSETADVTFEFGGIIPVRAGHEYYTSYRQGVYTDTTTAKYHESFKDLRFTGPRVAQYWMGNNPELTDIWNVCNIGEDWVTMPDGTDGVSEYFEAHYENGIVDYTTQVKQKEAWYKPTTPAAVHDSIHYNQIGYNEVGRESVRNALIYLGEIEAPEIDTTVEFLSWDGYTSAEEVTASKTGASQTLVVPKVSPVWKSKEVSYQLSNGLNYVYYDVLADNTQTTGTLTAIGANGVTVNVIKADPNAYFAEHLSELPEKVCASVNLWKELEHDKYYFSNGINWGIHSSGNVYSITIPVKEGDRIYASSFGKAGTNGHSSTNGIRMTYFGEYDVVKTMAPAEVYAEFSANGYLTTPEGTIAINIPMWTNSDEWEVYVETLPHIYEEVVTEPTCTEQGYTTYTCECGDSYVADEVKASGHSYGKWIAVDEDTREHICSSCGDMESIYRLDMPFSYTGDVYIETNNSGLYYGTHNLVDVLGLKSGTYTNGEVSITIDSNQISISGTTTKNTYFDLQTGEFGIPNYKKDAGYSLPDGDYRVGIAGGGAKMPTFCIRNADGNGNLVVTSNNTSIINKSDLSGADFGVPYLYMPIGTYEYEGNFLLTMGDSILYDNEVSDVSKIANTGDYYVDGYLWSSDSETAVFGPINNPSKDSGKIVYSPGKKEYINIFLPQNEGYQQIQMNLVNSTSTNAYGWRLDMMYACDNDLNQIFPITQSGEYEMAIKLKGRPDFMGMGAHGSEKMTDFGIYVDGNEIELSQIKTLTEWKTIRIVRYSDMYDSADETTVVATHMVQYDFDLTGVTVSQDVDWLVEDTCAISYMMMFPVRRSYMNLQITDTYIDDFESNEYDVSIDGFNTYPAKWTNGATKLTLSSVKSGVTATMESLSSTKLEGTGYKLCSPSSNYNKLYFTICGGGSKEQVVVSGDKWRTKTRYEVVLVEGTEVENSCVRGHDYGSVVTAPTCTEQGYTTHTCENCDDSYVDSYVEAAGHSYGEWFVTAESTCTADGEQRRDCDNCDDYETEVISKTGHSYKSVVTEPTCTDKGYTTHTCENCDDSYVDSYVEATGHNYGDWSVTTEATCTADGEKRRDCNNCDAYETEVISKTGHSYKSVVTLPTCTKQGYTTHTCENCTDSYIDAYVEATGHSYGEWFVTAESTCTADGEQRRDCDNCDDYETEVISKTGHSYKSVVTEPTCTDKGYTTHTCENCDDSYDDSYVDALGHSFGEWSVTTEVTCTEDGEKRRDCTNCDAFETEVIAKSGHNYKVEITEPTCTEQGYTTHTCENCDDSYVDSYVEAAGHSYGEWFVIAESTCTADGEKRRDCANCDAYETEVISKTGHSYKSVVTEPTCTEQGYTTHICENCDYSFVDSYVEATRHSYGEWQVTTDATCTEDGEKRRDCNNCDVYETEVITKTGHSYKSEVTAPTCTEAGYTTYTCENCNDSYVADEVKAIGHSYGAWHVTTEATCIADGEKRRDCANCDAFETEVIAKTGHSYKLVVTEPTCTEQGYTTHICENCDYSFVDSYVEATRHSYGEWQVTTDATCTEDGEKRRDCNNCDVYETEVITKTGHSYKSEVTAPTCTEAGYTTYTCENCSDSYVADKVKALGHSFGEWSVTTEATCTADGEKRRDCNNCDAYEKEVISKTGHSYKLVVTLPTCTEQGYTTHTCENCDDSYIDSYVEANGHSYGEWTVTKEVTCMTSGEQKRDCEHCVAYETEKINALGHDFGEWVTIKEVTCTENGEKRKDCSRCSSYSTQVIVAQGHKYTEIVTKPTCTEQGYTTYVCETCSHSEVDNYVEAKEHNWNAGVITTEASCKETGTLTYTCKSCGNIKTESIPKHDKHTYDNACDTTCNICEMERTITHEYQEVIGTDGISHWKECSVCGNKADIQMIVYGDVDEDGDIDAKDALAVLHFVADLGQLSERQMKIADVDANARTSVRDALLILKKAAGLVYVFPAEDLLQMSLSQSFAIEEKYYI